MTNSLLASHGKELLDQPDADPLQVRRNLKDIARANRWLGGRRALSRGLRHVLGEVPRGTRLSLLDIGTGGGDLPIFCRTWGRHRGLIIDPLGLERIPAAARVAAGSGLVTFVGCASAFPVRAKSVDVVLVSQVIHHFNRDAAVELLRRCDRFARRAVIMVELMRSRTAAAAYHVGSRILGFAPVSIEDGLTSIERGFTAEEARALLLAAGVSGDVSRVAPYRLVATWKPRERHRE